jgi:predicted ATP-dependent endonuclease of OLD family
MRIESVQLTNFRSHKDTFVKLNDYTILTGANSSGKSNFLYSLLMYYSYENFKFNSENDTFKNNLNESAEISVKYHLDSSDQSLKDKFKVCEECNGIEINENFKEKKYNYKISGKEPSKVTTDQIKTLGEVIFIPAIPNEDEAFKFSGPSMMRKAITTILEKILEADDSLKYVSQELRRKVRSWEEDNSQSSNSINSLMKRMNNEIKAMDLEMRLDSSEIDSTTFISKLINIQMKDTKLGKDIEQSTISTGQLRFLLYNLILELKNTLKKTDGSSENSSRLNLLIFEEPEAYLHPSQQRILCDRLTKLSKENGWQVVVTTHSPIFVSKDIKMVKDIIRMERDNEGITKSFQISDNDMTTLVKNKELHEYFNELYKGDKLDKEKKKEVTKQLEPFKNGLDEFRYQLDLNIERTSLFFANKVIICEGLSDKIFIEYILHKNSLDEGIYVLESLGKYNIPRFILLLTNFGIKHLIVYDTDDTNSKVQTLATCFNEYIDKSITNYTVDSFTFSPNIEAELKIYLGNDIKYEKPLFMLKHIAENSIPNLDNVELRVLEKINKLKES